MVHEVMPIAAPRPVFRFCDKAADDRIAVHVAELLGALGFGEDVEIVVADLPELLAVALETLRGFGFEYVEGCLQGLLFWFGQEEVNVLGHEDVAVDVEAVTFAEGFESLFEGDSGAVVFQIWKATVATEGDEV
jgi:hypothetical protein